MNRWFLGLIVVAGLAAAGWWGYRYNFESAEGLIRFTTSAAGKGDITQVVTATGQLSPVVNVIVGSQISGMIREILVDYNSPVKAGQVVARIDDATFRAHLLSAEGNLAQARARLQLANVQARRAEELFSDRNITQTALDQARAEQAQAAANVSVQEAAVARAKIDLERCTILSPVDGIVISRAIEVGQTVAASLAAPTLFTIAADLAKMQIVANVSEADIGQVAVDQRVHFTVDAFPQRTFAGRVAMVRNAPRMVENVVTYDTVVEVDNSELRLKPGMTANVQVVVAERRGVVRVPNAALRLRLAENQFVPEPPAADAGPAAGGAPPAAGRAPPEGARRSDGLGAGGGGPPGGGPRGGWVRRTRTAFVLTDETPGALPQAVTIRTGVTDGQFTEVLAGVEEGAKVVVAVEDLRAAAGGPGRPSSSPFGLPR